MNHCQAYLKLNLSFYLKELNAGNMPIYMDRHEVPANLHAEHVAEMHQADLKIQHLYGCKGLTYWCDEKRRTAFCLVEAPDKESLQKMHDHAHGDVPNRIIEVDENLVSAFLGRIEDPEPSGDTGLNIIDESAYRLIMIIRFKRDPAEFTDIDALRACVDIIRTETRIYKAHVVKSGVQGLLLSFITAAEAVEAALHFHEKIQSRLTDRNIGGLTFKISLSAGTPVTEKDGLFEETVTSGERMCMAGENCLLVTHEVRDLYEEETMRDFPGEVFISTLNKSELQFLNVLMDYTEASLQNTDFKVGHLVERLGYSKSQLYRKVVSLTGQSPNTFIRNFRLRNSLRLLEEGHRNIAQIAFDSGFNSPSYFTRCFHHAYGMLPSAYIKSQQEV